MIATLLLLAIGAGLVCAALYALFGKPYTPGRMSYLVSFLGFLLWEILASALGWKGVPEDALPRPNLGFWRVEGRRLTYWLIFALLALLIVAAIGVITKQYRRRHRMGHLASFIFLLLVAASVDVFTSIWYYRSLSPYALGYMGFPTARYYVDDHLIGWILVLVIIGIVSSAKYLLVRRRSWQRSSIM